MASKKRPKLPDDEFVAIVDVSIPEQEVEKLNRWLNVQYTGKQLLTNVRDISDAHKDAAYCLHRHRYHHLKFRIDMNGNWMFIGLV